MVTYLRFAFLTSLLPIIVTLLYSGISLAMPFSAIILFVILALIAPFFVKKMSVFKEDQGFIFHGGCLFYAWAFWSVFFLFGTMTIPISLPSHIGLVELLVKVISLLLFIFLEIATMILLEKWFKKSPRENWRQWADMCILILPLPMIILGDILFVHGIILTIPIYMQLFLLLLKYDLFFLCIMAMGTFAIYLYPRKEGECKGIRFARIVLTAIIWWFGNSLIFSNNYSTTMLNIANKIVPVFEGSILVYIVPPIFEIILIGIAFYLGYGFEKAMVRLIQKGKK